MSPDVDSRAGGGTPTFTHLDKVFYPAVGFTKGQVLDYYRRVAPALLPHLKKRALTLKRYPDGVERPFFYQKNCPRRRPPWLQTIAVWSEAKRKQIRFCVIEDLAALLWAVNLADLEMHCSLARVEDFTRPTSLVFDLDPGPPADILDCAQTALWLRDGLESAGLRGFPKSSGAKGMQILVPLNTPVDYAATKAFAHATAERLAAHFPRAVTAVMSKRLRRGRVLIDWSQNDLHKSTVSAYSLRAGSHPSVSTPLRWEEVENALAARDAGLLAFGPDQVLARLARHGDLYAPVLSLEQRLPAR